MSNNLSDLYRNDPVKACRLALRRTRNVPETDRLEVINTLLDGFGTEVIRGDWQNGYWLDIVAVYVNTGDTYSVTVIRQRGAHYLAPSRFFVSSFGDFVERGEKRFGIQ